MIRVFKIDKGFTIKSSCLIKIDEITVAGHDGTKPIYQTTLTVSLNNGKPDQTITLQEKSFLTIQDDLDITKHLENLKN